ncbi:MAG: glycosyltransferase family 8 protein [Treponema sp.]|nr:glycosyltransferase family 8 protein [Treponema sp.]
MRLDTKKEIPIFFASDNNYAPYLAVALKSLFVNASPKYFYNIRILTSNICSEYKAKILNTMPENASIEFVSVSKELDKIKSKLQLRDYYSMETYFRFFIPSMFPQYKKVLYLDSDIVVTGDISELYNTNITNYLVAAAPEQVMAHYDVFGNYVEQTLGVKVSKYFNAGILLINSDMFKAFDILGRFVKLLSRFKFRVTQDEDYLNVLCKDRVRYLDISWNKMPFNEPDFNDNDIKLIHYNLGWKPWHYDDVLYQEFFWKYAAQTDFNEMLKKTLAEYGDEQKLNDKKAYENLELLAMEDTTDPNNYKNTLDRERKGHYITNGLHRVVKMPGIKYLCRILGNQGYKILYGYTNRKGQRKIRSS